MDELFSLFRLLRKPPINRKRAKFHQFHLKIYGLSQDQTDPVNALLNCATMVHEVVRMVAQSVEGGVVADCGSFIPEEKPDKIVRRVLAITGKKKPN